MGGSPGSVFKKEYVLGCQGDSQQQPSVIGGFTGSFLSQGHALCGQPWARDSHPAEEVGGRGPDEAHEEDIEVLRALLRQTGKGWAGTMAARTVGETSIAQAPPPAAPWADAHPALRSHFMARSVDARALRNIGPRAWLIR